MQVLPDDVEKLSRGRASQAKIGSRATPHHLRAHEREKFEVAKRSGFLALKSNDRINLKNIYEKWCCSQGVLAVILDRSKGDTPTLTLSTPLANSGELLAPQHLKQFDEVRGALSNCYPAWEGFHRELESQARLSIPLETTPREFALQVKQLLRCR